MPWLNIPPSEWYARAGHCPLALTSRTTTIQPATPTTSGIRYPAQSPISCASQANSLASSSPLCRFWRTPRCYVNSQKLQGKKGSFEHGAFQKGLGSLKETRNPNLVCRFSMPSPTACFWYSICWNNLSTFFRNVWIFFLVGYHGLKHREGLGVKVVCLANVKGHRSNGEHLRDQVALPCSSHKSPFCHFLREKIQQGKRWLVCLLESWANIIIVSKYTYTHKYTYISHVKFSEVICSFKSLFLLWNPWD